MTRLPTPGQDQNTWGDILNNFLLASHKSDGSIKDNAVSAANIAPGSIQGNILANGSVTSTHIANGAISPAKLSATSPSASGQVLSYDGNGFAWTTVSIGDNSITATKLDTPNSPTSGQLLGYDGSEMRWVDPGTSSVAGWMLVIKSGINGEWPATRPTTSGGIILVVHPAAPAIDPPWVQDGDIRLRSAV